jgi:16S rRNA processing protein RimM
LPDRPAFVAVGKVLKPRGVQGEAQLLPLTDFLERFDDLKTVRLECENKTHVVLTVEYVHAYGNRLAIKFCGIDTPEAVLVYRNAYVQISQDDIHSLPDNTFYVFEIIGLPVESVSGKPLGRVMDVLSYPASDVYVIDNHGKEVLIPAVREIMTIDKVAGKVVVQNIEGLF